MRPRSKVSSRGKASYSTNPTPAVTLGEYLTFLLPRLESDRRLPRWPPDVFALCASLMLRSGAYCKTLTDWPPREPLKTTPRRWSRAIELLGLDWRVSWVHGQKAPAAIDQCWNVIKRNWATPITSIDSKAGLCPSILQLCAAADEASQDVGNIHAGDQGFVEESFNLRADALLERGSRGSNLCDEIDSSRARVLPKMHTPWSGLTIRSLSLYLSLCSVEEISPEWVLVGSYPERESMNLLLVPWPFTVTPSQFHSVKPAKGEMKNIPERFGFFTLQRGSSKALEVVERLYQTACDDMGQIDGVVLPELALSEAEHADVSQFVIDKEAFLISGVGDGATKAAHHDTNRVCFDIPHERALTQSKHHRWKLDASQVRQYGLGSRLSVNRNWWERLDVSDRRLLFVSLPALVMSVLICEDLARPDPVGDLVRAVGPNLVIALLMDGPQLRGRWPERYAMALADDPGSSVLTLTSLGMSELSRPAQGPSRSRVIALWKDRSGSSTEIELPPGCGGVVISLSFQLEEEWTADGRRDFGSAVFPTLSGVHGVKGLPKWFQS